jgi:hypothetical protein
MVEVFESAEELTAMATDEETVDSYNSANSTNLTTLPIAELYEYTMGKVASNNQPLLIPKT